MSHVDEGTLHAYLDGALPSGDRAALEAHLAQCAPCRDLLAEERALLDRASALLGAARPEERPAPSFEQVRRKPGRSFWRVRTSLAWAASLVVALGVGYLIRGSNARLPASALDEQRVALEEEPSAPEAQQAQTGARAPATPPALDAARQNKAARRPAAAPALGAQDRAYASVDTPRKQEHDTVVSSATPATQPTVQLRGAVSGVAVAGRQRVADSLARVPDSTLALNEAIVILDGAPVPSSRAATAGARRTDNRSVRNLVATTWPVISRGKAASLLGDRPVGVPGLATRQIRSSPDSDGTVVVEQALDTTTVIQIFQRPASVVEGNDPAAAYSGGARERSDRMLLARYVGRLRVEIAGPVSTDSLNKLLEQVEPIP